MNSKILNIGILAHIDAGKTSLTERLLFNNGAIKLLGSVDKGSTQTDTMILERQRGITIRSAIASFDYKDLKINLVDTPGHPDFIAEVKRALSILDVVVLVISAVEGIQPQTRVFMRTLKQLKVPTLIFVNKIDRVGAREIELLEDINQEFNIKVNALNTVENIGTRKTTVNPKQSQNLSKEGYPLIFGSAISGAGVDQLVETLRDYFVLNQESSLPLSGIIFKIDKGGRKEKVVYIRLYSGVLELRSEVEIHRRSNDKIFSFKHKVVNIQTFKDGRLIDSKIATAGDIIKVWGLNEAQVNDWVGVEPVFIKDFITKPNLEVLIKPKKPSDSAKLYSALTNISEQDPLINLNRDQEGKISIRLYGEVQKEIIQELLKTDYGVEVEFEKTKTLYVEKVVGTGISYANKVDKDNIFKATLGLKISPNLDNTGIIFIPGPGTGGLPTAFIKAVEETIYRTLKQGIYGWEVIDLIVEVTEVGYDDAATTGWDFRNITPLLLMEALQKAKTEVYQPVNKFHIDLPESVIQNIINVLIKHQSQIKSISANSIEGLIPVEQINSFEPKIPELTSDAGIFTSEFESYQKIHGTYPTCDRKDNNPLNRKEYLGKVINQKHSKS